MSAAPGLLFISHNLAVVRELCDRVAVLYASQIVEQGAAAEVLRRPLHPYTKGLIASLPPLRPAELGGASAVDRRAACRSRGATLELFLPPALCFCRSALPGGAAGSSRCRQRTFGAVLEIRRDRQLAECRSARTHPELGRRRNIGTGRRFAEAVPGEVSPR